MALTTQPLKKYWGLFRMKLVVYGADWCGLCNRLTDWLKQHKLDFEYKDVDQGDNRAEMSQLSDGNQTIPLLLVDGQPMINPDLSHLEQKLPSKDQAPGQDRLWDCLMVGAGPAALSAAVYTAREDISTLIVEKGVIGGLAAVTDRIDNYPGFAQGVAGLELAEQLQGQVERFGAKIELNQVTSITKDGDHFLVKLADGQSRAKTILVATGSEWKKLNIPGESDFYGKGIHNCATCDGAFYRDKHLVTIGSGNSSAQESLFLTKFAKQIDILIRGDQWKASEVLIKELEANPKITVHFKTTTKEIVGQDGQLKAVIAESDGQEKRFETDGVFVFVGLRPVTDYLKDSGVELNQYGFVETDDKLQTNVPGIFCAGDVRSGATMQIASASGEGATAALSIREYLNNL